MGRRARTPRGLGVLTLLLTVTLAGCMDGSADVNEQAPLTPIARPGGAQDDPSGLALTVQVLDVQILPIEGATVVLAPVNVVGTTDASGAVTFAPLEAGDYSVVAEAYGYAQATASVRVSADGPRQVTLELEPIATDVPYHETFILSMFMECSWAFNAAPLGSGRLPCTVVPLNFLVGQNVTSDSSTAQFEIPYDNLASLLWEMTWKQSTAAAGDLLVALTDPGGSVLPVNGVGGGVDTKIYLRVKGSSPIREMLVPGQEATGGAEPFDGNKSRAYDILVRGDYQNSTTIVAAVHLNVRVDNYLTFFYNRPGTKEFTALPEE